MQIPFLRVASLVLMTMLFALQPAVAQEALQVDVKKPEKFQEKKLGYEKTAEKKFTIPRRFAQNTFTHYNYYYNANVKLNEVLARAKAAHRDDFTQLLPFYNYTLDQTANDKTELDSVIYKSTVAILIHDLRSNWVDNMYMLMGKAYFFRNQLDSAYLTFQYINYAFAPKEKDGYDKVIGTNNSEEGTNAFSISTKEDKRIIKKVFTRPPSRNDALLWQIRTYLAHEELPEATGLIETLRNDPNFPERLRPELAEVQAHWFYKQNIYDSAAIYLEKALEVTETNQERARWEYLIAQLWERAGNSAEAEKFYGRAIKHTFDPIMEVHARLNSIKQNKGGEKDHIQENINELLKMARKDKYQNYRDVIYYTAAQMELERNNIAGARTLLLKSTKYTTDNQDQRNKSFLQLADLAFQEKDYQSARSYYDSVTAPGSQVDAVAFNQRKEMLGVIAGPTAIIYRQDSLQRIAAMPDKEREAFIRKLVKQARRAQGLKEEEGPNAASLNNPLVAAQQPTELFTNAPRGEWYFDNNPVKARGFTEFRSKWGNRPNVDNWRRQAAVNTAAISKGNDLKIGNTPAPASQNTAQEITYDAFNNNLPLTPERLKLSNDSIENALAELGRAFNEQLEDHSLAIETFERLLSRYPNTAHKQEALFNLYYAYWKKGDQAKASYYKIQLEQLFPGGKYANALNPQAAAQNPDSILKTNATRNYERIYTEFIEGNFAQAVADKKTADSLYGEKYWTAQLLYIEAMYHIKQRNDSLAKMSLVKLIGRFPQSPLRAKADNLLSVLNRRAEIETYLTNLQVQRVQEDTTGAVVTENKPTVIPQQPPQQQQPVVTAPPVKQPPPAEQKKNNDQKAVTLPPGAVKPAYTFKAEEPQLVIVVLDRVDPVYVTEARNAFNRYNREKYYTRTIEVNNVPLDDNIKLVVMNNFENANAAIDYVDKARKAAGSEIIPWMPPGKYTFYIISPQNLEVLKTTKDVKAYVQELSTAFPGKF